MLYSRDAVPSVPAASLRKNDDAVGPETFAQMLPQRLTVTLGPDAQKTFGLGLDGKPESGKFGHGTASAAAFSVNANDDLVVIITRNKIGTNYDKYNGKFWQAINDSLEPSKK